MVKNSLELAKLIAKASDDKKARKEIVRRYMDKTAWVKSCIINIARSGIFSSDRTIAEYAKDIWDVKPVDVQPLTHE